MKKYSGIAVSGGIGIGKAFVYSDAEYKTERKTDDPEKEKERYRIAARIFGEECKNNAVKVGKTAGASAAGILISHAALVGDPYSMSNAEKLIDGGISAEDAAKKVWREWKEALMSSPDELTRGRGADADDVLKGILSALSGQTETEIPDGAVLVCREFTPSLAVKSTNAAAVVSEKGSSTSHGAILAVSMGIPCVMGVNIEEIKTGDEIICDGESGSVTANPDSDEKEKYEKLKEEYSEKKKELEKYANMTAVSKNGKKIEVECNAGSLSDVTESVKLGGDGVGLFRTEFLFSERSAPPDEEEQFLLYRQAAQTLQGRELIIRTLDTGGDKKIPYLTYPVEDNPFLGLRGIRYCLANTEIFKTQIRAILRAASFGNVKIMLPMVTKAEEIEKAKEIIGECRRELVREGCTVAEKVPTGIMTETPAAALTAGELARCADFFSIGTNDLTQYIMAADRGNTEVKYLYDTNSSPVKRAVEMILKAAKEAGIPCHVCGEAAADENFLDFLITLGIDSVSVSPGRVAAVKKRIIEG